MRERNALVICLHMVATTLLLAVVIGCRPAADSPVAEEAESVCSYYSRKYDEMGQALGLIPPEVESKVRREGSREGRLRLLKENLEVQLGRIRAIEAQVRRDRRPLTELDHAFLRLIEAVQSSELVQIENLRYQIETGVDFRTDKPKHRVEATAAADRAVQEADDEFVRFFIVPCPGHGLGG